MKYADQRCPNIPVKQMTFAAAANVANVTQVNKLLLEEDGPACTAAGYTDVEKHSEYFRAALNI